MSLTIYQKLLSIQKNVKTFEQTEKSGNKKPDQKEAYNYTPGWKITEEFRQKMTEQGIMLIVNYDDSVFNELTYPVYKIINNEVKKVEKKICMETVRASYYFIDVESGEKTETFKITVNAANGMEKSGLTAISVTERYILLKFFHIGTKDPSDEIDAQNDSAVPGIPETVENARPAQVIASHGNIGQAQAQTFTPQPQAAAQQPIFQNNINVSATPTPTAPAAPVAPAYRPAATYGTQDMPQEIMQYVATPEQADAIGKAILNLMQFDCKTRSHKDILNRSLTELAKVGLPTSEPKLTMALVEYAQRSRLGQLENGQNF